MSLTITTNFDRAHYAWMDDAICQETYPDAFYPEPENSRKFVKTAKQICEICPVQAECLQYALSNDEPFGIWGGKTKGERRMLIEHNQQ